ncbi:MAG: Mur ligase domain-containing protein, partial [Candidatus Rokuibacteriota bacterium]
MRATAGALVAGDLGVPVAGVSIDSRTLGVGEVFFAIRGAVQDGHAYLGDAAARGAACLVVDAVPDDAPANVPLVLVEETTRALGRLAAWHRGRFDVPVVAVTGSNGKTTTKELIAGVLGTRWRLLKSAASYNNQWGLPLTLL